MCYSFGFVLCDLSADSIIIAGFLAFLAFVIYKMGKGPQSN